ncbi:histidine kinase [Methanosarcinales archaeon ex4484_138]|nr:MAG: histidine kinase [Methanosarcinales archaeon ex4484_138]RLG28131.1 MAG: histidine kinase [Methanosarcinales archaeon]
MNVGEVMNTEVITTTPDASIREVARLLREHGISGLPIVDGVELVGIVTETDILKLLKIHSASGNLWLPSPLEVIEVPIRELLNWEELKHSLEDTAEKPVRNIMKRRVHTTSPDESIEDASWKMVQHRVNRLPVVEAGKLIGIVARGDIINALSGEGD